ncbi:DUF4226 domain-containing protein [Mycobacterium simiae]|uniref:DUF4226 domain-containing protein n=1 Tax=Mycobacterium simiae TaxID=1784 RepID=A0A5B1BKF1_MYCSI|nr:DUF4226 domain-containing protein [Mycobacterium simiae]KAA1248441.1 DUF4226 domain-containing protein [Mycobacterium simiae]
MTGSRQRPKQGAAPAEAPSASSDRDRGNAANAIADAEAALAHQNSVSSQLDLQVVSAILNAHLKAVEGREALNKLQQETEAAVRTRSDLDTPAGARDFQRFLISKLRDIREVVANASLDDTSKAALMAAWTSLYNASRNEPASAPAPAAGIVEAAGSAGQQPGLAAGDPYLDSLLLDDPGLLAEEPAIMPSGTASAPPMVPTMPSMPNLGGLPMPAGAPLPGSGLGWNAPAGPPLPGLLRGAGPDPGDLDESEPDSDDPKPRDQTAPDDPAQDKQEEQDKDAPSGQPAATGPTTVTLPNGDTVTAASPQLAAAIKAAASGVPIPDAFQQQGITLPPPGTPVTHPIDASRLAPGDIGLLADRHALALGHGKALLDGQIQQVSSIGGPRFLGWEHPPTAPTTTSPAKADAPTPTRPASTPAASQY